MCKYLFLALVELCAVSMNNSNLDNLSVYISIDNEQQQIVTTSDGTIYKSRFSHNIDNRNECTVYYVQ